MRRLAVVIAWAMLISMIGAIDSAKASSARDLVPIAYRDISGNFRIGVFLGENGGNGVNPGFEKMTVRICSQVTCQVREEMSWNNWEGYSSHYWRWMSFPLDTDFLDTPVTAEVRLNVRNGSEVWSPPSKPLTISSTPVDPLVFFERQTTRPPLEIIYSSLDPTGMSRVDLCMNYRPSTTVSVFGSPAMVSFGLDVTGYPSIRSELYENGRLERTRTFDTTLSGPPGSLRIPGCDTGVLGSFLLSSIEGLKPGRPYRLMYILTGPGMEDLTATLDFVTPGACPSGEVVLAPSPRTFHYGVLNDEGVLVSYQFIHWWGQELPDRFAPIYHSGSKVIPFNGNLTEIRSSSEKWHFLRDVEEWALILDGEPPQSTADALQHTVFAQCRSTQVRTVLSIDETSMSAAEQACTISNNTVKPIKAGICKIEASITRRGAKSSTSISRKPTLITMNYVVTKVAKTKRLKNGATVTFKEKTRRSTHVSAQSLLAPTRNAKVVRLTSRTRSVCIANGLKLTMLKRGKCRYTARIVRKGKTSTVNGTIRVS